MGAQTRASDAVVVVDDGSTDDPGSVVARFREVRLIRQENRGLAAARNAGLAALDTTYVVFLDADDRLQPCAIESGVACFVRVPESGFVYGGHRYIDVGGAQIGQRFEPPGADPYLHLLRRNFVAMHGTVMYHRERLLAAGGFDERLRRCEDYDVYLRMAKRHRVTGYPDLVADYRQHDGNMSANHLAMLRSALQVHARHLPPRRFGPAARAWRAGRRHWRRCYAEEMVEARYRERQHGGSLRRSLPALRRIAVAAPAVAMRQVLGAVRRRAAELLPDALRDRLLKGRQYVPRVGTVRFGDLRRTRPVSARFGFDRGLPIDRHYIEYFLSRHTSEIRGRVLEIGDDHYTRTFGGPRVSRCDVLHVSAGNPQATFIGDLADPGVLPEQAFDCIVLTQTLQLMYDVPRAVGSLHRALAPGGAVLVTAPGISQIDGGQWRNTWFWSFTPLALERLFAEVFGADEVLVEQYGNVFAATAFLQGLAVEDVDISDLQPIDPAYPVIVGVRARKPSR